MATAIISAAGTVLVAVLSYALTKRAERAATWRREKLEHYKTFVGTLSGVLDGGVSPEGQEKFARACNDLLLFAPQPVIEALQRYQDEIRVTNEDRSTSRHDGLLSDLLLAIRRDLHVRPRDKAGSFRARLWALGPKQEGQ